MSETFFAHRGDAPDAPTWHPLKEHLLAVARLAAQRGDKFAAAPLAHAAGLMHDLGKYSPQFQARLRGSPQRVDHSTAAARLAAQRLGPPGKLLAYILAGHHAGLPDAGSPARPDSLTARLDPRKALPDCSAFAKEIQLPDSLPAPRPRRVGRPGFALSFLTRMIFSCLVDADFLDTESFCEPPRAALRPGPAGLPALLGALDSHIDAKAASANPTPVNIRRAEILRACRERAALPPGWFSLTVPTGGGKTLSSLAFALRHAVAHGLDRVIYAVPFTSIIEQNAQVFRDALGEPAVLEHHSNFDPAPQSDDQAALYDRLRLTAQNWDSPLVVTTNVQFFESLFAARPSRCRKLHNIARSVIVLDEAQMLPTDYLRPCLAALAELVANYGATVVLCTATQPALHELIPGRPAVTELAPDPAALHAALRRVRVHRAGPLDDDTLSARLAAHDQVLCVVNTRRHARELFARLAPANTAWHLSARMCPAHRSARLTEIRQALKDNRPCRVVSTQLIEAGVDVDFPVVYRAAAGVDSIAQAAGRCNREGRQAEGQVYLFQPASHGLPRGFLAHCADIATEVLRRHDDPLSGEAIRDYFEILYSLHAQEGDPASLDKKQILAELEKDSGQLDFPFRTIADMFRLIDADMLPVLIPWDPAARSLCEALRAGRIEHVSFRSLQKYTVQVYPNELRALQEARAVCSALDRFHVLTDGTLYNPQLGLLPTVAPEQPGAWFA